MNKFISSVRSAALFIAIVLSSSIIFSACKKENHSNTNIPVAALMAFNLAPDKPAVGFALSGNYLTKVPLGYASYTGDYLNIYPGQRSVDAYDANNSSAPFATATGNFETGKYYSLFLVGAGNNYKNIIVNDNVDSSLVSSGKAYIRYVNAITDSISAPTVTISAGGNDIINNPAPFASVSGFAAINPGDITISVKNAGTIDVTRTIPVEQKKVYTILLSGTPGSGATPVEIKYIINGTLADSTTNTALSAQHPTVN